MITRLAHICLQVKDIQRTVALRGGLSQMAFPIIFGGGSGFGMEGFRKRKWRFVTDLGCDLVQRVGRKGQEFASLLNPHFPDPAHGTGIVHP